MANPFEEIEKAERKAAPTAAPPASGNMFRDIEAPPMAAPPPAPVNDREYKPGFFGNLTDRLASGFTLGLTDLVSRLVNPKSAEHAEQFKKEHPYAATAGEIVGGMGPGIGAGLALGRAVPALGKATIPSMMGNAAISGGGLSAAEDLIKDQKIDPLKTLSAAGIGAGTAGIMGGVSRLFADPRFRAAGAELTPADKASMKELAATGDRAGIPLRIPELGAEVAPGRAGRLESIDNYSSRMTEGGVVRRNFDEARLPKLNTAIDKVREIAGPVPENGLRAKEVAEQAIDQANKLVQRSAAPYYKKAEDIVAPKVTDSTILRARKNVLRDPDIGPTLRGSDPNSVKVLQEAAGNLEDQIGKAATYPRKQGLLIEKKRGLLNSLEEAAPDFGTGQSIVAGGRGMIDDLKAGPLGVISGTDKTSAQARALLDAQPNSSRKATERLMLEGADVPRGIMASEVDRLAKDPVSFGRKLAPTPAAEQNIRTIIGDDDFAAIKDIITAARARTKAPAPSGENADGPVSALYNFAQNIQSGKVAKMLNDPKNIDKLNDPGFQRLFGALGYSLPSASTQLDDMPLVIDLKPRKKEKPVKRGAPYRDA